METRPRSRTARPAPFSTRPSASVTGHKMWSARPVPSQPPMRQLMRRLMPQPRPKPKPQPTRQHPRRIPLTGSALSPVPMSCRHCNTGNVPSSAGADHRTCSACASARTSCQCGNTTNAQSSARTKSANKIQITHKIGVMSSCRFSVVILSYVCIHIEGIITCVAVI